MSDLWRDKDAGADDLSQLVSLSTLIGSDPTLVQPGGGNTSVKLRESDVLGCEAQALVVKGSGTDLRTIGAQGFTHLYLEKLGGGPTPPPLPLPGAGRITPHQEVM